MWRVGLFLAIALFVTSVADARPCKTCQNCAPSGGNAQAQAAPAPAPAPSATVQRSYTYDPSITTGNSSSVRNVRQNRLPGWEYYRADRKARGGF